MQRLHISFLCLRYLRAQHRKVIIVFVDQLPRTCSTGRCDGRLICLRRSASFSQFPNLPSFISFQHYSAFTNSAGKFYTRFMTLRETFDCHCRISRIAKAIGRRYIAGVFVRCWCLTSQSWTQIEANSSYEPYCYYSDCAVDG